MDLTSGALVVRGGTVRDAYKVFVRVQLAISRGAGPVVSVWADDALPNESRTNLLRRICRDAGVPHKQVQVSTVERLLEAGFTLERDTSDGQPDCHHHVIFAEPVTESAAGTFIDAFDEPEPNPAGGKKPS